MSRQANKHGGGANTNKNGLKFEQTTSLDSALDVVGYKIDDNKVYLEKKLIGYSVPKKRLYSKFLKPMGIDYKDYNSKRWEPDECFINIKNKTAYIIEKKFQNGSGSVDEKLPGCHFKKQEYLKLFTPLGYNVEFLYVLNDWFLQDSYKDILEYIEQVGCKYYFNEIPLGYLEL